MSRIQHILDKAEREGVLHRTGPHGAAPRRRRPRRRGAEASSSEPARRPRPRRSRRRHAGPATLIPAARAIRSTVLDPYLVAAAQGTGIAAEQYRALRTRIMQTGHGGAVTRRARYQPRARRGQEPDGREPRPDDGAGLSAPDLRRRRRLSGTAAASAVRPARESGTVRRAPRPRAARRGAGHDRGAPADGAAGRTAAGSSRPSFSARRRCDGRSTRCGRASTAS